MADFDLSELDAVDESRFIAHETEAVRWVWVYAGPGHPKTIEVSNRNTKKVLNDERLKEQAVVNGKKWKGEDISVQEKEEEVVRIATDRLLDWYLEDAKTGEKLSSPPTLAGKPMPFSEEMARAYLRDPKRVSLLKKALEWLGDESSFTHRSATISEPSPGEHSSSIATKKVAPAETD